MVLEGLKLALSFGNILTAFVFTTFGIVIGALPGLGASMAMALVLPMTFGWRADTAIIALVSIYCGATYGGSISAILINAPGTPASGATVFDGYPMAQKGEADKALGISAMASFVGGLAGALVLFLVAPPFANFVLNFGPPEFFLLAIFGLTIISAVGKGQMLKGLIAGGLGLTLSFIGMDVMSGFMRFTFGSYYLEDGINSIAVMIGLFAISEVIVMSESSEGAISNVDTKVGSFSKVFQGCKTVFMYPITLIRSTIIGCIVGALPAMGVTTASLVSYLITVRTSKHPETFGKGNPEGVLSPEAANNAVTGTALIPTFTLGIPGSGAAAIILGALTIHGLLPGPDLFRVNAQYTYSMLWGLIIANFMMMALSLLGAGLFSRVTIVKKGILIPSVLVLCVAGAFALNRSWGDVVTAIVFGVVGYVFKKLKYPQLGLILGLILGPIAETAFHQSMRISGGNWRIFISRPISLFILACIAISLAYPVYLEIKYRASKTSEPIQT
mgnify:CR=1 FL=1